MLDTPTIQEVPGTPEGLHAFRITGSVTRDDMTAMGEYVLEIFDAAPSKIDMLLIFDGFEGSDPLASASWASIKSRTEALWHVEHYVTAGAPETASAMVEAIGKVIPPRARAFATAAEAWTYLGVHNPPAMTAHPA